MFRQKDVWLRKAQIIKSIFKKLDFHGSFFKMELYDLFTYNNILIIVL